MNWLKIRASHLSALHEIETINLRFSVVWLHAAWGTRFTVFLFS